MGIDYDPVLIIGWEIDEPEDCDDMNDYLEEVGEKLDLIPLTTGNSLSGDHRYFLSLEDPALALSEIANLPQHVAKAERDMEAAGVKFAPFSIQAELNIW